MGEEEKVYLDEAGLTRVLGKIKSNIVDRTIVVTPNLDYVYTYDGTKKETITNNPNLILSGDFEATNAGNYVFSVALKDSRTMIWEDGTNVEKYGTLTIHKASNKLTVDQTEFVVKLWKESLDPHAANILYRSTGEITVNISNTECGNVRVENDIILYTPNTTMSGDYNEYITVNDSGDINYNPSSCIIELNVLSTPKIVSWTTGTIDEIKDMVVGDAKGLIDIENYWADGDERDVQMAAIPASNSQPAQPVQTITFVLKTDTSIDLSTELPDGRSKSKFKVCMKNCFAEMNNRVIAPNVDTSSATSPSGYNVSPVMSWIDNLVTAALGDFADVFKSFNTAIQCWQMTKWKWDQYEQKYYSGPGGNPQSVSLNNKKLSINTAADGVKKNGNDGDSVAYLRGTIYRPTGNQSQLYYHRIDTNGNVADGTIPMAYNSYWYSQTYINGYIALFGVI